MLPMKPEHKPRRRRSEDPSRAGSGSSRKRKKKRRPPPKPDYLLWGIGIALVVGVLVLAGLLARNWWLDRNPDQAARVGGQEMAATIQDKYQGNYALVDGNALKKQDLLPRGVKAHPRRNALVSEWGDVVIMGTNAQGHTNPPYSHFLVIYENIPSDVCTQFSQGLWGDYETLWIGQQDRIPADGERVATASDIPARCTSNAKVNIMALGR